VDGSLTALDVLDGIRKWKAGQVGNFLSRCKGTPLFTLQAALKSYHYVQLSELDEFVNGDNKYNLDNVEVIMTTGAAVPSFYKEKIRRGMPNLKI